MLLRPKRPFRTARAVETLFGWEHIMDYEKIIEEIKAGLTGDTANDLAYLGGKAQEYRDSELGPEIVREIGRMVYGILPEEEKEKLREAMEKDELNIGSTLEKADSFISEGRIDEALETARAAVKKIEALELVAEDKVSIYLDFQEPFEEVLYRYRNRPEKELRPSPFRVSALYYLYGCLLFETKDYAAAEEALRTAVMWDPMNAAYSFEYFEVFKITGRLEEFFDLNKAFLPNCFRPWSFARAYRNLAFYYVEKKQYRDAAVCLKISGEFEEDSEALASELEYIKGMNGGEAYDIGYAETFIFCNAAGLPRYPDEMIPELASDVAEQYAEAGREDLAAYFNDIVEDLRPAEIKNTDPVIS